MDRINERLTGRINELAYRSKQAGSQSQCPHGKDGFCVMSGKKLKPSKSIEKSLFSEIRPIALSIQHLAHKAKQQYEMEVDEVIREQSRNRKRIEHLLDGMLDFCFDEGMLSLYKKLCRYYFSFALEATASYIYAYRDMWDADFGD